MRTLSVALWSTNLEAPVPSLADWIAAAEARMAECQAAGSRLLMMPEFACSQWLSFAPAGLAANEQIPWLAAMADQALPALKPLPARYGVALLAGTMPFTIGVDPSRQVNRAWLLLPDGQVFAQDKLCLTPSEQDPSGWLLTPGSQIAILSWDGLRIVILICLDIEYTALIHRLAERDLDLILVPAKTDMLSGYYRVFQAAKVRATELHTVVCVVGAVGSPLGHPAHDTVMGGAAAFLPCEASLGHTGIAAALEPQTPLSELSPMLLAQDLPVGFCRHLRHGGAEAEISPAFWSAEHIEVVEMAERGSAEQSVVV